MVQNRNIEVLNEILETNVDKEIVIGTHGTALSAILNYYDNSFNCDDFLRIIDWMPYIIELDFEGTKLVGKYEHCHIEKEFSGFFVSVNFSSSFKVYKFKRVVLIRFTFKN